MILSRISRRNIKGRPAYYVRVPIEWVVLMEARGVQNVQLEAVGDKGVLVINPVSDERMAVIRADRRRAAARARRRRTTA